MNLKEYQQAALETAMYPKEKKIALAYCTLGLCGEIGELLDPDLDTSINNDEAVLAECGDVCWYVATLAYELGISLVDLDQYPNVCLADVAYPVEDAAPAAACKAGLLANKVKKIIRDGKDVDSEWALQQLEEILGIISGIAVFYGTTLERVLEMNVEKLRSRKERGVIQGSGDKR